MKKFFSFLLCIVFLFASLSCGKKDSGEPDDKNNFENGNAANDTDGFIGGVIEDMPNPLDLPGEQILEFATVNHQRLTVAVDFILELFKKKYPNVTVNVRLFDDAGTYAKELKELILSGEYIPDLFLAPVNDEFLDDAVMQSKLCDIYDLMYEDTRFDEGEWYMQLIGAYARNGKLREFPVNVMPVFVNANSQISEDFTESFNEKKQVSLLEMIEINRQNEYMELSLFYGQSIENLHRYTQSYFTDRQTGRLDISGQEYLRFAEFSNRELSKWLKGGMREDYTFITSDIEKENGNIFMFSKPPVGMWIYILPPGNMTLSFSGMVPLADGRGRLLLDKMNNPMRFSVCEESNKKELAWELIKYLAGPAYYEYEELTKDIDMYLYFCVAMVNYMPVYKPTLKKKIEIYLSSGDFTFSPRTYRLNFDLPSEKRADYLMDFYERLVQNEFVYQADDWKFRAMFNAVLYYLAYTEYNDTNVPLAEIMASMQKEYGNLVQNDPAMRWLWDLYESEEYRAENPFFFLPNVTETECFEYILRNEFTKLIMSYGFPE